MLVAVGGGAGALGRAVATALGLEIVVPQGAEVISSIGDALSLVRAERERTYASPPSPADVDALVEEVEAEVLAAGVAPASVDVHVIRVPERGAVRAVATGALALASGVTAGRPPITDHEAAGIVRERGLAAAAPAAIGPYWLAADDGKVLVLDRFGDVVLEVKGEAVVGPALAGSADAAALAPLLDRHVRHMGPVTVAPTAWLLRGSRLAELGEPDAPALADVVAAHAHHPDLALVVGRS